MVEPMIGEEHAKLTAVLRDIGEKNDAGVQDRSLLLRALINAPRSPTLKQFVDGRTALLLSVIEHMATRLPVGSFNPRDAGYQERALKKMLQLLPKLLEELEPSRGGRGGSMAPASGRGSSGGGRDGGSASHMEVSARYATFAMQLAGRLLSRLPHVLCSNSSVGATTVVDLMVGPLARMCRSEVNAHLRGVLGGLSQVAKSHAGEYQHNSKRLIKAFLTVDVKNSPLLNALAEPSLSGPRHLAAMLLGQRTIIPDDRQTNNAVLRERIQIALHALDHFQSLYPSQGAPLGSTDVNTIIDHVLPTLALAAARCLLLTGPQCRLASRLHEVTKMLLSYSVVPVPSGAKVVIHTLVLLHGTRAKLLLRMQGQICLHRAHAALSTESQTSQMRQMWSNAYAELNFNLKAMTTQFSTHWPCNIEVATQPSLQSNHLPEHPQPEDLRRILTTVQTFFGFWAKFMAGNNDLLTFATCVANLAEKAKVEKVTRKGYLPPLQKEWVDNVSRAVQKYVPNQLN